MTGKRWLEEEPEEKSRQRETVKTWAGMWHRMF
jgi:hypothetical protein